jgi:hypothetical protein
VQDVGDFLVEVAAGEELEDFVFSGGEVGGGGNGRAARALSASAYSPT